MNLPKNHYCKIHDDNAIISHEKMYVKMSHMPLYSASFFCGDSIQKEQFEILCFLSSGQQ